MKISRFSCCFGLLLAASTCFAQMYTVKDLGTLGGRYSYAAGINASGQVVGSAATSGYALHAFRTAPNTPINPVTDDLGILEGELPDCVPPYYPPSYATGINASGQVVGFAAANVLIFPEDPGFCHPDDNSFRTAPNSPINPAADDLGPGEATAIDDYGQVVGFPGFIYSNGVMQTLNNLVPSGSSCTLGSGWTYQGLGGNELTSMTVDRSLRRQTAVASRTRFFSLPYIGPSCSAP